MVMQCCSQVTSNLPWCSSLIPCHGALPSVHHMYKRMPSTCSNKVDTCPPGTKQGREYLADEVRKRKKKKLESQPMPTKCMRCIAKAIEALVTPPPPTTTTTPPPVVVTGLRSSPRLMRNVKLTCCNYGKNWKLCGVTNSIFVPSVMIGIIFQMMQNGNANVILQDLDALQIIHHCTIQPSRRKSILENGGIQAEHGS